MDFHCTPHKKRLEIHRTDLCTLDAISRGIASRVYTSRVYSSPVKSGLMKLSSLTVGGEEAPNDDTESEDDVELAEGIHAEEIVRGLVSAQKT